MPKKKTEKPQRILTKHQLSRWQQQERRRRLTLGIGVFIIVAVFAVVGVGWYTSQYQPRHQTVIRVNDTKFNMGYYVDMLKLYASNQAPESTGYLANLAVDIIEQNELVKQAAAKLGVSVKDDRVITELKNTKLSDSPAQRDLIRAQLLNRKLLDEHFNQQIPISGEQLHLMAMLLESESPAKEIRARLEKGDNFTALAKEFSLDFFSKANQGDYGWHPQAILKELLPAHVVEYAFSSKAGELSPPIYDEETKKAVGYWLVRVLDRDDTEEEAHIQVMLLGSEEKAKEVRDKLRAGEDFATLAKQFSQLEGVAENKGEYLVGSGMLSPVVDKFTFNLEIDTRTLSEPIRDESATTKGGYWLVKVVAQEPDRKIETKDRDWLKAKALDEWVSALRNDPTNVVDHSYLDNAKKEWAIKQARKG